MTRFESEVYDFQLAQWATLQVGVPLAVLGTYGPSFLG